MKSGYLNFLEPSGPLQACKVTVLPLYDMMIYDMIRNNMIRYDTIQYDPMIYLLNAIGLTPGGSITVHIYTQTIHRTTQITTNLDECGPCHVFASFTLAFTLQLRKKHGKTSVRVKKEE